jgi:hypothetical protein
MKRSLLSAIALGAALVAVPLCASAESNATVLLSGSVCGHLDVNPLRVLALQYQTIPGNIIVARSATEVVSTSVEPNGNFCFPHLQPNLHTISAFGDDSPGQYNATVTPIPGQTRYVEVTRTGGL